MNYTDAYSRKRSAIIGLFLGITLLSAIVLGPAYVIFYISDNLTKLNLFLAEPFRIENIDVACGFIFWVGCVYLMGIKTIWDALREYSSGKDWKVEISDREFIFSSALESEQKSLKISKSLLKSVEHDSNYGVSHDSERIIFNLTDGKQHILQDSIPFRLETLKEQIGLNLMQVDDIRDLGSRRSA